MFKIKNNNHGTIDKIYKLKANINARMYRRFTGAQLRLEFRLINIIRSCIESRKIHIYANFWATV